jgi:2-iminobutanoate/2-iminopropanoate deaminase
MRRIPPEVTAAATAPAEPVAPAGLPTGPTERFAYSYAVRTGAVLWLSGQVALDAAGKVVGVGDIQAQATQVFENLRAVMTAAGGGLDDLVATTSYTVDRSLLGVINDVRRRYLTGTVKPTSTLIVVAGLARPEFLLEVEAVAVLPAALHPPDRPA